MGRKTSSAIPPKLTAKKQSAQFHRYAMLRAVLLTQSARSSAGSEVFFTLLQYRIYTNIGSLKMLYAAVLSPSLPFNHYDYTTFFSPCQ